MAELITPQEAEARWPTADYPPDTLGGIRRENVRRFWQLAEEIAASVGGTPAENEVLDMLSAAAVEIAEHHDRIDELQEIGLRQAFSHIMGYDLPD